MINGHGDDAYAYDTAITANFSSNVCPDIDLSGLKAHLRACLDTLGSYPEPEPYTLEARLADRFRLPKGGVCVTNGATEAIYLLAQTFRGSGSAVVQPTFSEYADACRMHAHTVKTLYALPGSREQYRLPEGVGMLWLCNPNNPTGLVTDREILTRVVERNPQVCFVIDQSYEAFTLERLWSPAEAAAFPNVLLLHSLTKRYAVPGLRLGYVTGVPSLLQRLRANRMPWSVNQLAIQAGMYLLDHPEEAPMEVEPYLRETRRLRQRLESLGAVEVWDTQTHFLLARLRVGRAAALKDYLAKEHGLLIRDASNFEGLDDCFFRIATQRPEENDRLVVAIEQWLKI